MSGTIDESLPFTPLSIAVLTISDTRTPETDTSGQTLADRIEKAGHSVGARLIVTDDIERIRTTIRGLVADKSIQAVITSGGTGLTGRDSTIEAVKPLFDKEIDGFSAVFHAVSYKTVGTSTMQSRAMAGIIGSTYVFCLPGSTGAVKDGWDEILRFQLDSRHKPCNFVTIIPRLQESRNEPAV
jgi:molybdenum cofactor biosynthesis protein B